MSTEPAPALNTNRNLANSVNTDNPTRRQEQRYCTHWQECIALLLPLTQPLPSKATPASHKGLKQIFLKSAWHKVTNLHAPVAASLGETRWRSRCMGRGPWRGVSASGASAEAPAGKNLPSLAASRNTLQQPEKKNPSHINANSPN